MLEAGPQRLDGITTGGGPTMDQITGTYRVLSIERETADGTVTPLGDHPDGLLIYGPDGAMTAVVSAADRPLLDLDLLTGERGATEAERAAAFDSASAFAGHYIVVGGTEIHHHIAVSTVPNWVGTVQVRPFELDGDRLVLRPPGMKLTARRWSPPDAAP
jgi:hypothetical protein